MNAGEQDVDEKKKKKKRWKLILIEIIIDNINPIDNIPPGDTIQFNIDCIGLTSHLLLSRPPLVSLVFVSDGRHKPHNTTIIHNHYVVVLLNVCF